MQLYLPLDWNTVQGNIPRDLSGHERHGTISWASPKPGRHGDALSFNGTTDYLDTGYTFKIESDEAWTFLMHLRAEPGATGVFMGVGRAWDGLWNRLQLNFNTDKARVYVRDDSYNLIANVTGSRNIADGAWHCIALIVSPIDDEVKLYVDGSEDGSASAAFNSLDTGINPLHYGCLYNAGARSDYACCILDEIRILDRGMSVQEIESYVEGVVLR